MWMAISFVRRTAEPVPSSYVLRTYGAPACFLLRLVVLGAYVIDVLAYFHQAFMGWGLVAWEQGLAARTAGYQPSQVCPAPSRYMY